MKIQNVIVQCEHGLHLRVASKVSKIARSSGVPISILCADCPKIDACSVLDLLTLGATQGTPLEIAVEEADEYKANALLQELAQVFEDGGGI